MPLFLFHHADMLVTMYAQRREIRDGAVAVRDNVVAWAGTTAEAPEEWRGADVRTIDARGKIILPGFVNTHHHFYQTLTRVIPAAQNAMLFDWLKALYPIWAELRPKDVRL